MKKYIVIVSIILAFMSPMISFAKNETILSMEELTIQVMPEFAYHPNDKKREHAPLLIGYHGSMVNNSEQPQKGQIEIPLPMEEKNFQIGYVADYSIDLATAYEIEYAIDLDNGTISWTTSEEIGPNERYKFVIEFYTDSLKVEEEKKSLAYQFKSFADIGLVNVIFTQPNKAGKMELIPAPEEQKHGDGENQFSYLFQGVKAGEEKSFTLNYVRSETLPTTELVNAKNLNVDQEKKDTKTNKLAIGALSGIALLSLGALTYVMKNRKKQQ
ncbi:MAG: hypothetical protein K6T88_05320 [Bacillus sp. (in: Bacteria)]|nr:hypothetical protein [Bacillus sp. (in: firmicutes)]